MNKIISNNKAIYRVIFEIQNSHYKDSTKDYFLNLIDKYKTKSIIFGYKLYDFDGLIDYIYNDNSHEFVNPLKTISNFINLTTVTEKDNIFGAETKTDVSLLNFANKNKVLYELSNFLNNTSKGVFIERIDDASVNNVFHYLCNIVGHDEFENNVIKDAVKLLKNRVITK